MESSKCYIIRTYQPDDENSWLRCRVLAFLDTAYFDDVCREKEHYESRAIELVAELDGEIVGLIDVECREKSGEVWNLAVHPDYRRQGIGSALLARAKEKAQDWGLEQFEAWTRDDEFVGRWYRSQGFECTESYYHVYIEREEEMEGVISLGIPGIRPLSVFAHYVGNDAGILGRFRRVHECNKYELRLSGSIAK